MYTTRQSNKPLGVFTLIMINIIAIDSLRNLPANAASGYSIISYYAIAALCFLLPCALITAELATHYPERGGVYVWVREAFGKPGAFITVWLQWIYNVVWYPTILLFIANNIAYLVFPELQTDSQFVVPRLFDLSMVLGLFFIASLVNSYGMKISGLVSNISAIMGTLIPMGILIIIGINYASSHTADLPSASQFLPSFGSNNNLALLGVVMFSLMGLEMSAVHAKEVRKPKKDYPRALRISGIIIALTLILATLAIVVIVPPNQLQIISGMDKAFSIFFNQSGLSWMLPIVIIMIIVGAFGGMAAWVIGPTKALMVAAEDGLLPQWLAKTNQRQAPTRILFIQFVLVAMMSCLYLFFKNIETPYFILSAITNVLALLFYVIFFSAAIKLKKRLPKDDNAYRIAGSKKIGTWLMASVGIATCMAVIGFSFIPPSSIPTGNLAVYEGLLIGGSLLFVLLPLIWLKWRD